MFCRTPLWHHLMICSSFRQIPSLVIIIKSSGTNQSNHINAINYITEACREGGWEREQDHRMDRYKEEKKKNRRLPVSSNPSALPNLVDYDETSYIITDSVSALSLTVAYHITRGTRQHIKEKKKEITSCNKKKMINLGPLPHGTQQK